MSLINDFINLNVTRKQGPSSPLSPHSRMVQSGGRIKGFYSIVLYTSSIAWWHSESSWVRRS